MSASSRSSNGSAPAGTVIALHSSGAGSSQWRAYAQALPEGVTLYAPDLIGYGAGAAAWPARGALALDDEATRLAPLLHRGAEPVDLVGHSYGGAIALQLALHWPQRVRSLTLYEPVRFGMLRHGAPEAWREIVAVGGRIAKLLLAGDVDTSAGRFVDYWSGPGSFAALPPAAQQRIAGRMSKVSAEFEALFADEQTASDLAASCVPLRLLVGTHSPAPAQRVSELLAAAWPGAALVRLPGAGHLAPLHEPQRVLPWLPFAGPSSSPLAA